MEMSGSLIIDSLAVLHIHATVKFPPDAKLIVKRGGTLILDEGILTNKCMQMWKGIEVWGNSNQPQIPSSNNSQGIVILKNNSIIENARHGISMCRKNENGEILWNYTGGLVSASNTLFRNNFKAVEFEFYKFRNYSSFKNCTFEVTSPLPDYNNGKRKEMVSLYEVKGVVFSGCSFRNTAKAIQKEDMYNGIYSIDASYFVNDLCTSNTTPCPPSSIKKSSFTGLRYGVHAINSNPSRSVKIAYSHAIIEGSILENQILQKLHGVRFLLLSSILRF